MKPKQTIVNSEVLLGFDEFVTSLGVDSHALYKQFGVSPELIANKNIKLPFAIVAGLLESAANRSQQEDFSLNFAAAQGKLKTQRTSPQIGHFDSLENVLVAAMKAMKHYNLPGSEINWSLKTAGKKAYLTRLERLNHQVNSRHYTSLVMARCHIALQELYGRNWRPLELLFSFQAPKNIRPYLHHFGVPVKFDQEHTQIIFSAEALKLNRINNRAVSLQKKTKTPYQNDTDRFLAHVHALVRQALHNGQCQAETIAEVLGIHTKKLQRDLHKLDTNFQDIRHQVRLDEAAYYLKNSTILITDIAEILGYSEASALSRAFKVRYGKTPSAWRKIS